MDCADNDCCTLVSRSEVCWESGLFRFAGLGDPKLRYCELSVAKSSAKKSPGLFAASKLVESKNSKSGSESSRPDMSESRMKGGELAEYTASAEVCMTLQNVQYTVVWHCFRFAS